MKNFAEIGYPHIQYVQLPNGNCIAFDAPDAMVQNMHVSTSPSVEHTKAYLQDAGIDEQIMQVQTTPETHMATIIEYAYWAGKNDKPIEIWD